MFGNNEVQVEEEKFAFSLPSLVAECGGTLGLFVGFNFLMVWDFVIKSLVKMKSHFTADRG